MIVYLSGPITLGSTVIEASQKEAFLEVFYREAVRLRGLGYSVINPAEVPEEPDWEAYMRHGLRAVASCEMVGVLPRWVESSGAMLEVYVARILKIPVHPVEEIGVTV